MTIAICLTGIVGSALILVVYALCKTAGDADRMMEKFNEEFKPTDKGE